MKEPSMALMRVRRLVAEEWELKDPILRYGDMGVDLDTGKFKLGDGLKNWSDLSAYLPEHLLPSAGSVGPEGPRGDTGLTGPQGEVGPEGSPGPPGLVLLSQPKIQRDGWGAVDISPAGIYKIETLEIPPGTWSIFVPIRMRWSATPGSRIDFYFALAADFPEPEIMEPSDQTNIGPMGIGDAAYPLGLCVSNSQYTEIDVLCRTYSDHQGQIQDGDTLRFGVAG